MKYPFPVKHNGIDYEPGQEVPIGQEPVKENADKERLQRKQAGHHRHPDAGVHDKEPPPHPRGDYRRC